LRVVGFGSNQASTCFFNHSLDFPQSQFGTLRKYQSNSERGTRALLGLHHLHPSMSDIFLNPNMVTDISFFHHPHSEHLHVHCSGQDSFRTLTKRYWAGADIVIIVFDLTRRETFDSVTSWLKEAREVLHNWKELQFALIGNKCDLDDEREVSKEVVEGLAKREGLYYTETSAKTGENVNRMFGHLAENTLERIRPLMRPSESFRLTDDHVKAEESWYGKMYNYGGYCSIL